MANRINVTIKSNVDAFINAKDEDIKRALEAIGQKAEGYAQMLCPVDTGYLRNSITHAVAGGEFSTGHYQSNSVHADTPATRRAGTAGKGVEVRHGEYSGTIGDEREESVYIGSNVEYASYVETGTRRTKAQPFLKPAVEDHKDEYRQIAERYLKGGI